MTSVVTALALSIAATLGALRGIDAGPEDGCPFDVPPAARVLLANVKADVRDMAAALLPETAGDAKRLQRAMNDALANAGALEKCNQWYGQLEPLEVTSPGDGLIAVVARPDIPFGSDAALFLFRHDRGGWQLVLDRENNGYEDIAGAAGSFQFHVSPPDGRGARLVLTADINPSCASMWQGLRWDVHRIDPDGRTAARIAGGTEFIYLDGPIDLAVAPDGFSVDYTGASIDPGRGSRQYHRHYRIDSGDRIVRVEPIATTPLEYVEEWLILNGDDWSGDDAETGEFLPLQRCRDGTWQIEHDSYGTDDGPSHAVWFVVAGESGAFRMISSGEEPRDDCADVSDPSPAPREE